MTNLLITGSLAYDRIAVFQDKFANHIMPDKIHQLNVCFTVEDMEVYYGGTAGNLAYNLNLLGENPPVLGALGKDGKTYLDYLKEKAIQTEFMSQSETRLTANAMIMTDLNDNQILSFYVGAMVEARELRIESCEQEIDLVIIAPNDMPTMSMYAEHCRQKNIRFIADPGQQITVFSANQLQNFAKGAHVLILNDYEWNLFQQMTGWTLEITLKEVGFLIITLGEKGSQIHSKEGIIDVPAYPPKVVVDPTGAGDAYRAGLLYGLKQGLSMEKSAHLGAWLASKCIEKKGTQNHQVEEKEWQEFYSTL